MPSARRYHAARSAESLGGPGPRTGSDGLPDYGLRRSGRPARCPVPAPPGRSRRRAVSTSRPASSAQPRSSSAETRRSAVAADPAAWRLALPRLLEHRGQRDRGGRGVVLRRCRPWSRVAPVSGSCRGHSRMTRPSNRARSSASGSQTSTTATPPGARCSARARIAARCAARSGSTRSELRAMNASPKRPASGKPEPDEVRLDQRQALDRRRAGERGARPGAGEHGRIEVDAGDTVPARGQGHGQSSGPDRELEDRPGCPLGQREVEIEVARDRRPGRGRTGGPGRPPWRGPAS